MCYAYNVNTACVLGACYIVQAFDIAKTYVPAACDRSNLPVGVSDGPQLWS